MKTLDELNEVQKKHEPIASMDNPPVRFFKGMGNKQAELRRTGELWDALSDAIQQIEGLRELLQETAEIVERIGALLTAVDMSMRLAQLEAENAALKGGIRDAMNNLGVPNAGYPSPVAEAWAILAALLTAEEQEDETE